MTNYNPAASGIISDGVTAMYTRDLARRAPASVDYMRGNSATTRLLTAEEYATAGIHVEVRKAETMTSEAPRKKRKR